MISSYDVSEKCISKWGSSLAVRLRKKLVDPLRLSPGGELSVVDGDILYGEDMQHRRGIGALTIRNPFVESGA
jgi:antitoxin component of MazEF toxin-antitoxin module